MIPNVFHFCYGLMREAHFGFLEYLAIRSAYAVNRPERIYLHYQYDCAGPWWEKAKQIVTLNRVEAPSEIFGRKIHHFAHRSDVLRLSLLKEHGGIYMDIDTLCLRSFRPLLGHRCVLGWEGVRGPCNAVILSEPNGQFISAWLDSYRSFRSLGKDQYWDEHSVVVPGRLARQRRLRPHVTLLDDRALFFPLWDGMHHLFESGDPACFRGSYCVHYWESKTYRQWLSGITADNAVAGNTNFSRFARRALGSQRPGEEPCAEADALSPSAPGRATRSVRSSLHRVLPIGSIGHRLRWLWEQARGVVWVPTLLRNLGWRPAAIYIAKRLRVTTGTARGPFVVLRSKYAAHPLKCRASYKDLDRFDRVFVHRAYRCLDDRNLAGLIVDCGANAGYASAYFLTRFPSARLIALEPDPDAFSLLEANLEPYGDRCRTMCSAVWSPPRGMVFEESASGPGRAWRRRVRPAAADEVPAVTATDIPTVLQESGCSRISLLRVNIGGAESDLFAADCQPWIDRVDNIVIELHEQDGRSAMIEAIASNGYAVSQSRHVLCCTRTQNS